MKKNKALLLVAVVILATALYFVMSSESSSYVSYTDFVSRMEEGTLSSVSFSDRKLVFRTSEGEVLSTDNPHSATLEETLLLKGVAVSHVNEDSVNLVLDIVFDVVFFGAVIFGVVKLLDFRKKTFKVVHKTGVRFDDIAGMDDLKKEMMFAVDVLKNPSKYSSIRQTKGIILEGPPGNGKTLFAKALAQESDVNFIAAKGADFQSAMMSMGARKIKMLFNKARRTRPCVVFIDEFDSIGERRNYAGTGVDKENNRIITTMLNEMDGFTAQSGILVVAATNSYQSLDPALVRPGRFDLKYTIGNPDAKTRLRLIEIYSRGKVIDAELSFQRLCDMFDGLSCAAIEAVLNESSQLQMQRGASSITVDILLEACLKTGIKVVRKK